MKVLIDASIIVKGGGLQVALSLINNIALDKDFELICVVSPQLDSQIEEKIKNNISYYHVEKNEPIFNKFKQGKRLANIENLYKPDFVFVIFGPAYWKPKAPSLQGFALGKMLYKKELSIGLLENIFNTIKKNLFKKSNSYLVVETDLVKNKLSDDFNYPLEKIFVIGNSYSPKFLECVNEKKDTLMKRKDIFSILVPGSYYLHKNLEMILISLAELKKTSSLSGIKVFFTIPKDSIDWQNFFNYAKKLKVDEYIETAGFVANADFAKLYIKSDVILCASLVESSTAVFPEAFISERPLLVSDRPFASELCENAALYFDPLDAINIAESIKKIKDDSLLRKQLILNGKSVLLKNYPSAEEKWQLQKKLILQLNGK